MNETQYYSAKTDPWGEVVGFEKDGYFHFLCFCENNPHEAKTAFYTDLTPVKFVPQDAVVIEGVTANELAMIALYSEVPADMTIKRYSEICRIINLATVQLTPPKPRPEEPKGFGAMVEASVSGWGDNRVPLVSVNGRWWVKNNLYFKYSDLIDPIITSEGQVK